MSMLFKAKIPEIICRASNVAGGGIVSVDAVNVGTQAAAALVVGTAFTKWFEVKGKYATLFVKWVKGGATNLQLGFTIFGGDAYPSRDEDVVFTTAGVQSVNTDQKMFGTSYQLLESSMGTGTGVAWVTPLMTADATVAIPVHFGVNNRATPATVPVALDAAAFPGRYARVGVTITGANVTTTTLGVDIGWAE